MGETPKQKAARIAKAKAATRTSDAADQGIAKLGRIRAENLKPDKKSR